MRGHVTRCDIRDWPELGAVGKLSLPTVAILSSQGTRSPKMKGFLKMELTELPFWKQVHLALSLQKPV